MKGEFDPEILFNPRSNTLFDHRYGLGSDAIDRPIELSDLLVEIGESPIDLGDDDRASRWRSRWQARNASLRSSGAENSCARRAILGTRMSYSLSKTERFLWSDVLFRVPSLRRFVALFKPSSLT